MWVQSGDRGFSLLTHIPSDKTWQCHEVETTPPERRRFFHDAPKRRCPPPQGDLSPKAEGPICLSAASLHLERWTQPTIDTSHPVELQKLVARPELNGQRGFRQTFDYSSGRWQVVVPPSSGPPSGEGDKRFSQRTLSESVRDESEFSSQEHPFPIL